MSIADKPSGSFTEPGGFLVPFGVTLKPKRLRTALTHKSYAAENINSPHNERLEFLGDAVLDQVVSWRLFQSFPNLTEGELSPRRAAIVSEVSLAALARGIDLGPYIRLGRGEHRSGGFDKESILADTLEAIIGAVFEEHGYKTAETFVNRLIDPQFEKLEELILFFDPKTTLQEEAGRRGITLPKYEISGEGPNHDRVYIAKLNFDGIWGAGKGKSKKVAEINAARKIVTELVRVKGFKS